MMNCWRLGIRLSPLLDLGSWLEGVATTRGTDFWFLLPLHSWMALWGWSGSGSGVELTYSKHFIRCCMIWDERPNHYWDPNTDGCLDKTRVRGCTVFGLWEHRKSWSFGYGTTVARGNKLPAQAKEILMPLEGWAGPHQGLPISESLMRLTQEYASKLPTLSLLWPQHIWIFPVAHIC